MLTGATIVASALSVVPASAAPGDQFGCRASAARATTVSPPATSEPVRANAALSPCQTQSASVLEPTTVGPATADVVGAFTKVEGAAGALGSAARAKVTLPGLTVEADEVQASAGVGCESGRVGKPAGASRVVGLKVNGTAVTVPPGDAPFTLPLGPAGTLMLNEEVVEGATLTRRAIHLKTPSADVVLAEAVVTTTGNPCAPLSPTTPTPTPTATPTPTPTPGGGSGGGGTSGGGTGGSNNNSSNTNNNSGSNRPAPRPCPPGAEYDVDRNLCVIERQGKETIIVGPPFSGPSGGTVVALDEAVKKFVSPCLKGSGPKFAIIGSAKADKITGTNRRDRILSLAGKDNVEGGRGDDCIDGGTQGDTLSGALGKDRIIGGSGNDHLIGGSAADFLEGGSGNDTIHSGYGRDVVMGGSGGDKINAATAGPASKKLDCGKGRDKIRVNRNEKRIVRGCETVYKIR